MESKGGGKGAPSHFSRENNRATGRGTARGVLQRGTGVSPRVERGDMRDNGNAQLPSESIVSEERRKKTEVIAAGRGKKRRRRKIRTSLEEYTGDTQKNTNRDLYGISFEAEGYEIPKTWGCCHLLVNHGAPGAA